MAVQIPVTRTKILLPRRRTDLLPRKRLLDLLSDLLDLKLTIIAAPAGYGKTSLLIDFAHGTRMPVCWYALDPLDQDLQRFAAHFIAALTQKFPKFGKTSQATLQSLTQDQVDLDSLISVIVNDAYENITEHFVMVLDDFHLVEESKLIVQFVNQFIQLMDENCHVAIASRTLLTLPDMPLLVARAQVGGLDFNELVFQPEEIRLLWKKNYHSVLTEEESNALAEATEGWITGLLLTTQLSQNQVADRLRLARVAGVSLYDYLAQQVLERQLPEVQTFLLQTSLLEEFDASLCVEVIGTALDINPEWNDLMETVQRSNLFILPVGEDRVWLRYHHLFRDFLQERMRRYFPAETSRILMRLADVYASYGEWERSYTVYKRLGQGELLAGLVERAGSPLISRGRLSTLSEWLEEVGEEGLDRHPALLALRGTVAIMRGESQSGLDLMNRAVISLKRGAPAGAPEVLAQVLLRRSTAHRMTGDYRLALEDADEALGLLQHIHTEEQTRADAIWAKGIIFFMQGQPGEALVWLGDAFRAYQQLGDEDTMAKVSVQVGMFSRTLGQYPAAEKAYNRALEYYQVSGNLIWQADLYNNLGVLQQLQGDYEAAVISFDKAIQYARVGGYTRLEAYSLAGIGDLYRDLDTVHEAIEAYHQARLIALRLNDRFMLFYLDVQEACIARLQGYTEKVQAMLESAQVLADQSSSSYQQNLCRLEWGVWRVLQHDLKAALPDLNTCCAYFEQERYRVEGLRAHFYLALALRAMGDKALALEHWDKVLKMLVEPGNESALVTTAREHRAVLEQMRSEAQFDMAASALLRQVEKMEQRLPLLRRMLRRQSAVVPLGAPRMVVRSLGKMQVRVNDHVVTSAEWQTQTARDLLFILLAHPEGLTKEEIGEILWPDSSPSELKLRFKNNIYRLRHAVGKDVILFNEDIYRFNHFMDYEFDAETFQKELEQAEKAWDAEKKIEHYRSAVNIYKGNYLPELSDLWVLTERESLNRAAQDCLLKLGGLYLEKRQYETALGCCQRILQDDPCQETAHRLCMQIYAAMGNRAAVVRQYEQCCLVLKTEIAALPSSQTRQLYESLIH
jgi:ATP/maltotriose-dependent transcriptional regulator MalT/two-component SAPR family response regulator